MSEVKAKRKKDKRILIAAAAIAVVAAISAFLPESVWNALFVKAGLVPSAYRSAPMSVHFVDVGQGDCTVITTDDGETVLIDSGEEIKADAVIKYLGGLSVKKLDYCIVTHPHSDHCGGMKKILEKIPAENVIMPKIGDVGDIDDICTDFLNFVDNNCPNVTYLEKDETVKLKETEFGILVPVSQNEDLNNMSLVVKASYKNASFLITGDCSFDEENDILKRCSPRDLKCSVLKAGHHGSSKATGEKWLDTLRPDICVFSVGKNNSYGHPSPETVEKLESRGIEYYRTDISGTLVFDCDENGITLK